MAPTLFLIVGHVGAGKSTYARELAQRRPALRLTPDEWMMPLFGHPDGGGKRDVLEGRLLAVAADALALGVHVILDFGFWSRNERAAMRWMAALLGASAETVYLDIDPETQWQRIEQRWAQSPEGTWRATAEDVAGWRAMLEEPDDEELTGQGDPAPPQPHRDWSTWIAERWDYVVADSSD